MNQLDIGEFDIDGISVGIGISEEVIAARFPSEGVAAAVYLEVAAAVYVCAAATTTSCGYRDVAAQRNERRGVGRAAARLQGFVQGFVGGDAGSTAAYHHFIRNLRLRVPAGDVAAGEFHFSVARAGFFLQLEVEGEPLAAFEAGLVAGFGSVQVGRYMNSTTHPRLRLF